MLWSDAEFDLLSGTQGWLYGPCSGAVVGWAGWGGACCQVEQASTVLYVLYSLTKPCENR